MAETQGQRTVEASPLKREREESPRARKARLLAQFRQLFSADLRLPQMQHPKLDTTALLQAISCLQSEVTFLPKLKILEASRRLLARDPALPRARSAKYYEAKTFLEGKAATSAGGREEQRLSELLTKALVTLTGDIPREPILDKLSKRVKKEHLSLQKYGVCAEKCILQADPLRCPPLDFKFRSGGDAEANLQSVDYDELEYSQAYSELPEHHQTCSEAGPGFDAAIADALKTARKMQSGRSDREMLAKRLASEAVNEVFKRYSRSQRIQRDHVLRGRKLYKDVVVYWRKREKQLIDIKKKKERLEAELKKRDEEVRDNNLHKKRLQFLMKQSDLYAHFMSKKLGLEGGRKDVTLEQVREEQELQAGLVDNDLVLMNVQQMHQQNQQDLKEYQQGKLDLSKVDDVNYLVKPPESFKGSLKEYQLNGLRWLDNLYEQGINGILADEMGLGKTIQAIALMAHIGEKGFWGPFLVVAPSSTLFNWKHEIEKFCPSLKVLPYWGNIKERKTIRKFFSNKRFTGRRDSQFHVVVTSYQLIVADEKAFHRLKWQYMVLDEAQAIKNVTSQRWKTLMGFHSRNRLLLTGTPIQNTMAELWALLHFIMPKLFDSHEQFQEWFSKDIEAHSQDQKKLNEHQVQRLHKILKPFMLRRVKKDVEHEIGKKIEYQVECEMTARQHKLYEMIKQKLSLKDLFRMTESKAKVDNLMNLVMQFRKVCNHPELFERRVHRTPFLCARPQPLTLELVPPGQPLHLHLNLHSAVHFPLPRLLYDSLPPPHLPKTHAVRLDWPRLLSLLKHFGLPATIMDCFLFKGLTPIYLIHALWSVQRQRGGTLLVGDKGSLVLELQQQVPRMYIPTVVAPPILPYVERRSFMTQVDQWQGCNSAVVGQLYGRRAIANGTRVEYVRESLTPVEMVQVSSMIGDSAKMKYLDRLLKEKKALGQRVLIFCQMTKMLDILEDYMLSMNYQYLRLDGSANISDRRDMVHEYQNNPKVFAFLLSTRAGGLGVTLTAADVVIFYDNDWNPTMDAQATDRAHRIGRKDDVYVYRLVTKGTIEERIVKRAQQKQTVQSTVYEGSLKAQDIFELVFDKDELEEEQKKKEQLVKLGKIQVKPKDI